MSVEFVTHSPEQTAQLAERVAAALHSGDVILYEGEMGAGKTAFTKGLAAALGITEAVTSPTFALVNEYRRGTRPVFHFDMYRIQDDDELYSSGFYDYESRGGYCLAEWCENIPWALPPQYIRVVISKTDGGNGRLITAECINTEEADK